MTEEWGSGMSGNILLQKAALSFCEADWQDACLTLLPRSLQRTLVSESQAIPAQTITPHWLPSSCNDLAFS